MAGTRSSCAQLLSFVTIILVASYALTSVCLGQDLSAELPSNCSAYASVPLPAEAKNIAIPTTPPSCASYRSYRGIGRPVNYVRARECAWRERLAQKANLGENEDQPDAWIVGGSLVLADIYINGAGVKRDIPLAMRLACESEEGMASLALPDVRKFARSPRTHRLFEFCHYAASTITMSFCSDYTSQVDAARRNRYYTSLRSFMTSKQQAAFTKLLTAESAYIKAHADEVDQGGTIRAIRTINSQSILEDLFHAEVVHFEHKKWPRLPETQITMADALLQREYEKKLKSLRTQSKDDISEGAVTAGNLATVEKTWKLYRDAWVAFARLRYPASVDAIQAQITLDRYRLVKTITVYP